MVDSPRNEDGWLTNCCSLYKSMYSNYDKVKNEKADSCCKHFYQSLFVLVGLSFFSYFSLGTA